MSDTIVILCAESQVDRLRQRVQAIAQHLHPPKFRSLGLQLSPVALANLPETSLDDWIARVSVQNFGSTIELHDLSGGAGECDFAGNLDFDFERDYDLDFAVRY
jgi:hypothetical protein